MRPAYERLIPALPVLTYFKYAPLRFSVSAILDYWAENDETLGGIVNHVLIHEIGHHFGLSDDDMEKLEADADQ